MPVLLPYVGYFLIRRGRLMVVLRSFHRYFRPDKGFPFERRLDHPVHHLLIAGDSTAIGTGATKPEKSLSGLFAEKYLDWSVSVLGRNGLFLRQLPKLLQHYQGHVDTLIMLAGGNDVMQGTSPAEMERGIEASIVAAKRVADRTFVICQGNLGNVPLFPMAMRRRLEKRSRQLHDFLSRAAERHGTGFVDLFYEPADDPWKDRVDYFYAIDLFHPGAGGYRMWFEQIDAALAGGSTKNERPASVLFGKSNR